MVYSRSSMFEGLFDEGADSEQDQGNHHHRPQRQQHVGRKDRDLPTTGKLPLAHPNARTRHLRPQPHSRTIIKEVPEEMILQILSCDLSTQDIVNFRRASKKFTPACAELLIKRLRCLYIHPSRSSLRAAHEICHHPWIGQNIEEVVLLGKVLWLDIQRTMPDESMVTADETPQEQTARLPRPWPVAYPKAKDKTQTIIDGLNSMTLQDADFDVDYEPLFDALAKLQCLKKISFAEHVNRPGWNKTSEAVMNEHAKRMGKAREPELESNVDLQEVEKREANWAHGGERKSDAQVLLYILSHAKLNFTELAITTELPVGIATRDPESHGNPPDLRFQRPWAQLSNLTKLELHFDHGWRDSKWHIFSRFLVQHARQHLKSLRLVWRPNAAVTTAKEELALRYVLAPLEGQKGLPDEPLVMPQLSTLEIVSLSIKGAQTRPVCHLFDIKAFIDRHASTLEEVNIRNTTFLKPSLNPSDWRLVPTVRKGIEALVQCRKLQNVTWTISRFGHDARCMLTDDMSMEECTLQCGVYSNLTLELVPFGLGELPKVHDVELLANELGVNLDPEGKRWNFGDYVRQRQEQLRSEDGEGLLRRAAGLLGW
ncbi:hypothetical protein LTR85_012119 [Meristemomyces frigidus]|nr:hypothetical protein LTR85_012119 [Meristemomyces frigidus]